MACAQGMAMKFDSALFDRRFRVQAAFYLGILCLFLLLRPPVPWINYLMIGYLVLFWPIYFLVIRRRRD